MVKLYIALKQRFVFQKGQGICLKDIATLWSPQGLPKGIEKLRVQQSRPQGMEPVSFVAVCALIQAHYPGYELVQAGEIEVWLMPQPPSPKGGFSAFWHTALAVLILALGAGFGVVYFHADVDMPKVHQQIYEMVTGEQQERPLWVSLPYSVGLAVGAGIFFLRPGARKYQEPTPLELKEFTYAQDVENFRKNQLGGGGS